MNECSTAALASPEQRLPGRAQATLVWCISGFALAIGESVTRYFRTSSFDGIEFVPFGVAWFVIGVVLLYLHFVNLWGGGRFRCDLLFAALVPATVGLWYGLDACEDALRGPRDADGLRALFARHRTDLERVRRECFEDHASPELLHARGVLRIVANASEIEFVVREDPGSAIHHTHSYGICWRTEPAPAEWCSERRPDWAARYWPLDNCWYACHKVDGHVDRVPESFR